MTRETFAPMISRHFGQYDRLTNQAAAFGKSATAAPQLEAQR
jgi:hypothetical protein